MDENPISCWGVSETLFTASQALVRVHLLLDRLIIADEEVGDDDMNVPRGIVPSAL